MQNQKIQPQEIRIQDYIGVVYRKKWVVLISLILIMGFSVFYALSTPPIYISSATIKIDTRALTTQQGGATVVQNIAQSVDYYDRIFRTGIFQKEVEDSLTRVLPVETFDQLPQLLQRALTLEADVVQTFFRITATANDPETAYRLADVSSRLFQKRIDEIESQSTNESDTYLEEKLDLIKNRLETVEMDIQNFSKRHGLVPLEEVEGTPKSDFISMQTKLEEIQLQRDLAETRLRGLQKRRTELLSPQTASVSGQSLEKVKDNLRALAVKQDSLERSKTDALRRLDAQDPQIVALNRQIADYKRQEQLIISQSNLSATKENQNILPLLQTRILEAEQALFDLNTEAEYYEEKVRESTVDNPNAMDQELELQRLMHSRRLFETSYNALIKLREEQQFQKVTQSGGVKMIDPANYPSEPVPSTAPQKILFGTVLGLFLGLGAAFLLEYMDTSLKTSEDVSRFLGIALIGEIPKIKDTTEKETSKGWLNRFSIQDGKSPQTYNARLISQFSPRDPIPEAYRNVRTSLQYTFVDDPLHCFVISSPNASEGKSLTTSNLAIGFAESGKKTVIVDTDLRRPVVHKIFGLDKEPGITDVLAQRVSLKDALKKTFQENLYILPAGQSTPNPGEIVSSQRMDEILKELQGMMDIILMDSPPVIAAIDAAILGAKTQGVLLVFNMDETKREAAKYCIEQIERSGARVIGGLLNNIDVDRRYGYYYSYRYYYRYKYYSKYYYGYGDDDKKSAGDTG